MAMMAVYVALQLRMAVRGEVACSSAEVCPWERAAGLVAVAVVVASFEDPFAASRHLAFASASAPFVEE